MPLFNTLSISSKICEEEESEEEEFEGQKYRKYRQPRKRNTEKK
jgi:hypothetical protein